MNNNKTLLIDSNEGSCRVKVMNPDGNVHIIITGDILQLKSVAEFRKQTSGASEACRFCSTKLTDKNKAADPRTQALANVCTDSCYCFMLFIFF